MNRLTDLEHDFPIFLTPEGGFQLSVRYQEESLWLTLDQIAALFERDKSVISRHLKNIFQEEELIRDAVVANYATTAHLSIGLIPSEELHFVFQLFLFFNFCSRFLLPRLICFSIGEAFIPSGVCFESLHKPLILVGLFCLQFKR